MFTIDLLSPLFSTVDDLAVEGLGLFRRIFLKPQLTIITENIMFILRMVNKVMNHAFS